MSTFAFFGEIFMKIFHFGENLTFLLKKCETFAKICDFHNNSQEYKWALLEEKTFSDCITLFSVMPPITHNCSCSVNCLIFFYGSATQFCVGRLVSTQISKQANSRLSGPWLMLISQTKCNSQVGRKNRALQSHADPILSKQPPLLKDVILILLPEPINTS